MTRKTFKEMIGYHAWDIEALDDPMVVPLPAFAEAYCQANPEFREGVESTYRAWLSTAKEWIEDPQNPVKAYHFLDGHPSFWTFEPSNGTDDAMEIMDRGEVTDLDAFMRASKLRTAGFARSFWKAIGGKNNTYMMECGSAVPPLRAYHYHDIDVDAYAESFEACYVQTAEYVFSINSFSEDNDSRHRDYFNGKE